MPEQSSSRRMALIRESLVFQLKLVAEKLLQRQNHGGDQIGATAHRLGQQNIKRLGTTEPIRGGDEFIETAAETRAGDFADVESLRTEILGIDQIVGLVVGDLIHAVRVAVGQPEDGDIRLQPVRIGA